MAFIAPGFSFQDGITDQCSADNLHSLVDSATVTAITMAEYNDTTSFIFQVSSSAPGTDQGEYGYRYDPDTDTLREKRDGRWDDVNYRPELLAEEAILHGSPLKSTADNKVSPTASSSAIIGVAASSAASGNPVLLNTFGYHPVLLSGAISRGDPVVSSDVTGYARSGTMIDGTLDWFMGIDFGLSMGSAGTSFTGLVTCFLYR